MPSIANGWRSHRPLKSRAVVVLVLSIFALSYLVTLVPTASAGGGAQFGGSTSTSYTTVTAGLSGPGPALTSFQQGDYVVVIIGFEGTGQTVKSISDTGSTSF